MREIKFRAPDSITGQYVYFTLNQLGQTATCDMGLSLDLSKSEQFTGLREKNGKEIYEGDIIKGDVILEVVFNSYSWAVKINSMYYNFADCDLESCEVIGNIHENPELLK